LFVGMVTDIANIIIKGIMAGHENVFTDVFNWRMAPAIVLSLGGLVVTFGAAALASLPGIVGTVANYGALVLMLVNLFIGVPIYLVQIMVMSITSGILFSYAIFFYTRIFVIQILTVLAPLAILAAALPQTKDYFDMWKKWLLGWAFGGILVLFLLVLGLARVDTLTQLPNDPYASAGFGEWVFNMAMGWQFKWLALAIYMLTVEALCLALIPELAKTFEKKAKEVTKGKTIKKITGAFKDNVDENTKNVGKFGKSYSGQTTLDDF